MDQPSQTPETQVNVINPNGELVSIPHAQLSEALGYGYRTPSASELQEHALKSEYGEGKLNELKAFGLGAAGMASLGLIPKALSNSGLVPSEEQAALAKYNPHARMAGEGAGLFGTIAATLATGGGLEAAAGGVGAAEAAAEGLGAAAEGVAAKSAGGLGLKSLLNPVEGVTKLGEAVSDAAMPVAKNLAGKIASESAHPIVNELIAKGASKAVGSAVEGALFGLGGAIDESALGDPDALGEHLLSHVSLGAALGFGLGGALGATEAGIKLGSDSSLLPAFLKKAPEGGEYTEAALRDAIAENAEGSLEHAPAQMQPPQSISDIQSVIQRAAAEGVSPGELVSKRTLSDAIKAVPDLKYPVNNIQLESLSDANARTIYKTLQEGDSEVGEALRSYEALQKRELGERLDTAIQKVSPTMALTQDPIKAGDSLVDSFVGSYQSEKKALAPLFKTLDEAGLKAIDHRTDLIDLADKAIPGSKDLIQITENGLQLVKYKPTLPISKTAYEALSDVLDAVNDKELTFGGLRNIRDSVRDRINWMLVPRESAQLSALSRELMNFMQDKLDQTGIGVNAREAFKRYAINEEQRGVIERIFGGSISDKATFAKQIKSEEVLDRLFSNTVSIQAAKEILPKEVFNKAVGDYLSIKKAQFTDLARNGFSSQKFANFLKTKAPELSVALSDHPNALAEMPAITDILRILPDSPSINPSGTAKTLNTMKKIHQLTDIFNPGRAAMKYLGQKLEAFSGRMDAKNTEKILNEILSGKNFDQATEAMKQRSRIYQVMKYIEESYQKSQKLMEKASKSIFLPTQTALHAGIYMARPETLTQDHYEKMTESMNRFSNDPEAMIDHLDQTTRGLSAVAPQTAVSYHQTAARAAGFLQSKLPRPGSVRPLSPKYTPSAAELGQFNRYYQIVRNPFHALNQVKEGTITPESVETLQNVYPKLYQQMQASVMDELTTRLSKEAQIPYSTKLALSVFLQQDLDDSMTNQHVLDNQMILSQAQNMSAQNAPAGRRKKDMRSLSRSEASLTDMQASAQRREA